LKNNKINAGFGRHLFYDNILIKRGLKLTLFIKNKTRPPFSSEQRSQTEDNRGILSKKATNGTFIRVHAKSSRKAKLKLKELTSRNQGRNSFLLKKRCFIGRTS
jgi:hypothetical protein